jgi:uroporphyrinogen decarboxylase
MRFVPVVYEHAAALIGRRPYDVARDADLLAAAHAAAFERYHHSPVVAGIDVYNVEAEAYGAQLRDAGGISIPTIETSPCGGVKDLLSLAPLDPSTGGRLPLVIEAARKLRERCSGARVAIPLSGPFSIAQGLLGMEGVLYATMEEPDTVHDALMVIAGHLGPLVQRIHDAGCESILFESSASPPLLSPALFRTLEIPALALIGATHRRVTGRTMPMILGGNTLPVINDLIRAGAGSVICPAELDGSRFLDAMSAFPDVEVRINMRPGVFAASVEEAIAGAGQAIALARRRDNVCIGSGVLPFDAKPDIVLRIKHLIEEAE